MSTKWGMIVLFVVIIFLISAGIMVKYQLMQSSGQYIKGVGKPIVVPSPTKSAFIFDVVYTGFNDVHLQKIKDLGVNNLTIFLCWSMTEPSNNTYNFSVMNQRMTKYSSLGMPAANVVIDWWNCKPTWLGNYTETDSVFVNELAEFANVSAKRYENTTKYWSIGNEMNGLWWVNSTIDARKVQLYKKVAASVKSGNPKARVGTRLAFDSWATTNANWVKFVREIKNSSDWVGIQVYPVAAGYVPENHAIRSAVNLAKGVTGLPVWVTETGASNCQCRIAGSTTNNWELCETGKSSCSVWVTKELQANYTRAAVEDAYNAGAIGVSIYAYGGDTQGYSIIDEYQYFKNGWSFSPKPAYYAYQKIISDLKNPFFVSK